MILTFLSQASRLPRLLPPRFPIPLTPRLSRPRPLHTAATMSARTALSPTLHVHAVPIHSTNYSYILADTTAGTATLVDPAEPAKLLAAARDLGLTVTASLTTHHHWDHAGGNAELARLVPGVEIVGSADEPAEAATVRVRDGDVRRAAGGVEYRVVSTPCHTMGHVCYVVEGADETAVFSGDTLFLAGCGKFFEGNAEDMVGSMDRLAALGERVLVFCGHEYTVSNLEFAASLEPAGEVADRLAAARGVRKEGGFTVPGTMGVEVKTNPFMRTGEVAIARAVGAEGAGRVEVMRKLREKKNEFRS